MADTVVINRLQCYDTPFFAQIAFQVCFDAATSNKILSGWRVGKMMDKKFVLSQHSPSDLQNLLEQPCRLLALTQAVI